jgi:hypothetical protein
MADAAARAHGCRGVLRLGLLLAASACTFSRTLGADPSNATRPLAESDGGSARNSRDAGPDAAPSGGPSAPACSPPLASQLFRRALCACGDVTIGGTFGTDSFDSTQGPFIPTAPPSPNAAVGCNAGLDLGGVASLGGDLTVADPTGLKLGSLTTVRGSLRVNGPITIGGVIEVLQDAQLAGGIQGVGTLHIGRDLVLPPGAPIVPLIVTIDGNQSRKSLAIDPPCPCAPSQVPDLAAAIADASMSNDNLAQAFDPAALNVVSSTQTVVLDGNVYVSGLNVLEALAALTLVVHRSAKLFIGGDLVVNGNLTAQVDDGAELDLYVAGGMAVSGVQGFGAVEAPARVRVYVAGDGPVMFRGTVSVGANLYAPQASVMLQGGPTLFGSVFAQRFVAEGRTSIHYDSASIAADDGCTSATPCASCDECAATRACVAGSCGACQRDADCCEPLVCDQGRCLLEPL